MAKKTPESGFASALGVAEWEFRIIPGRTRIDYDADKNIANRSKHKIDLESAAHLLGKCVFSKGRMITKDGFLENGEMRHMHLVKDDDSAILMVVTTMRPNETIRVISVRPASEVERQAFHNLTTPVAQS